MIIRYLDPRGWGGGQLLRGVRFYMGAGDE